MAAWAMAEATSSGSSASESAREGAMARVSLDGDVTGGIPLRRSERTQGLDEIQDLSERERYVARPSATRWRLGNTS